MMTMTNVFIIGLFFLIYAVLGWCLEVVYHAVEKGVVVNRGFLNGPLCPIYGAGMVAIIVLTGLLAYTLGMQTLSLPVLFLAGVVLCSAIELFGGWALDKLFHTRWWDYTNEPFNIGGYICLKFSLAWGVAVVFTMRLIHPVIESFAFLVSSFTVGWIITLILYIIFIADIIITVSVIIGLNKRLTEIDNMRAELRKFSDGLTIRVADSAIETKGALEEIQTVAGEKSEAYQRELQHQKELLQAKMDGLSGLVSDSTASTREKLAELQNAAGMRSDAYQRELQMRKDALQTKMDALHQRFDRALSVENRLFKAFPSLQKPDHRELMNDLLAYTLRKEEKEKAEV